MVAPSTGNHGAAVAYAAKLLHIPATTFLPRDPNPVKRAKIAERYRRGKLWRARLGEVIFWKAPYGYRRVSRSAKYHGPPGGL